MNKQDFLKQHGLNFTIKPCQIQIVLDDSPHSGVVINDLKHRALVNTKNARNLGIVSNQYQVFSNENMFDLAAQVTDQLDDTQVTNAFAAKDGEYVVFNILLGEENPLKQFGIKDPTRRYVNIINRNNGDGALKILVSDIRIRCLNQLPYLMNTRHGVKNGSNIWNISIRHTASMDEKVKQTMEALLEIRQSSEVLNGVAAGLFNRKLSTNFNQYSEWYRDFVDEAVQIENEVNRNNLVSDLESAYLHNTNDEIRGTAWGWLNGVTYYADHMKKIRKDSADNRLYANLLGSSAQLKMKALQFLGV